MDNFILPLQLIFAICGAWLFLDRFFPKVLDDNTRDLE
jgi:hypothetical protein